MSELNEYDLYNLRHMLGMNWTPKKDHGYRNRFTAAPGEQLESLRKLEALGMVIETSKGDKLVSFSATEAGCKAAGLDEMGIKRAMGD